MAFDLHTVDVLLGSTLTNSDRLMVGNYTGLAFAASAASVTALGTITPGTGFTTIAGLTLTASGGTGSGLTAMPLSLKCVSATVVSGGASGFAASDTITLSNGVVLTVATVSSGVVLTATVSTAGAFTTASTNPVSQTATSGSGVGTTTWTLAYGLGTAAVTNSGSYTGAPSMTVTGGGGTGASIGACTLGGNGAGISVGVAHSYPAAYSVQATSSVPAFVSVPANLQTQAGFTVLVTPIASGSTLAAGVVNALVIA
jgi:hypothetical protein